MSFRKNSAIAYRDSQNAPKAVNSTPVNVFPLRNWIDPGDQLGIPPNISATPKTTG